MLNHNSAFERDETPHTINPTQNDTLKVNPLLPSNVARSL
jgi:hypothetical protein